MIRVPKLLFLTVIQPSSSLPATFLLSTGAAEDDQFEEEKELIMREIERVAHMYSPDC